MDISAEEWTKMKLCVESLDKNINGNGRPGMETRLRDYIDQRDQHKERNAKQDMLDLRNEQDERHQENSKKFDRLFQLVYIGMGIMIALESVGIFKK